LIIEYCVLIILSLPAQTAGAPSPEEKRAREIRAQSRDNAAKDDAAPCKGDAATATRHSESTLEYPSHYRHEYQTPRRHQ